MGVSNILPIGECEITYNSVDLGLTKGGCELHIMDSIHKTTVDKYGDTPVKAFDKGVNVEFSVTLIEQSYTILEQALRSSGTKGTTPDRITFGSESGNAITGAALRAHPRNVTGGDDDIIIYAAVPELDTVVPYNLEGEPVYPVKFFGLIDTSRSDGDLLFRIGNDS